jgi:hypothetical protein
MPSLRKRQTWAAGAALAVILLAACTGPAAPAPAATTPRGVPPAPPEHTGPVAPGEPPSVWVAGTLTDVTDSRIDLREASGQKVSLQRLAAGTTAFYRVSRGTWEKLAPEAPVAAGQAACAQALLDGTNLIALRVFLGSGCGPA